MRDDHGGADGVKACTQWFATQHEPRARHGLVFPGPRCVAATLLLVVGVGFKAGDQHARIAVGPQGGVDLVQVAFSGLHGQPVDQFAHQGGVDLTGTFIIVLVDEHNVEVTAVPQFLAAELAIGNDGKLMGLAVPGFEAIPAPARRDAQHGFGQGTQIVRDLLDGQGAFNIARQRAEYFRMVGTAQQIQQCLVVVFAGDLQGSAAALQIPLEVCCAEALLQYFIAGQLVNHAGVLEQVAGGPARRAQHAQQPLVHRGALQQQGQITLAPQQGLDPVGNAHGGVFIHTAVLQPPPCAGHQPDQPVARILAQCHDPGVPLPQRHPLAKLFWQMGQYFLKINALGCRFPAATGFAVGVAATEQRVEFLGYKLAVGVQQAQELAGINTAHRLRDPVEVVVLRRQHVRLLVIKVLNAVLDSPKKVIGR